jgi:hypothetical protein
MATSHLSDSLSESTHFTLFDVTKLLFVALGYGFFSVQTIRLCLIAAPLFLGGQTPGQMARRKHLKQQERE